MGKVKELLLDDDWDEPVFPVSLERHPNDRTFYTVSYYGKEVGFVQWCKELQLWRAVSGVTDKAFYLDGQNAAINKVMEEMA